ncbi:MAG: DUF1028 domain-containing protein [Actinomycetota bacterium]
MTFSIAAWDPSATPHEWGIAVASKFLAVGAAVPWAKAGAGAVATQALANLAYGPEGLEMLQKGMPANAVVRMLTGSDDQRQHRQVGIVDATGVAATFTGTECFEWAGGRTGDGYCCQGNILTGPEVVDDMCETFERAEGELADRLLAALQAGDRAGGDRRGRQSAAILVVREGGGYGGGTDVAVDLRVDDHDDPVPELFRLFDIQRLLFPRPEDLDFVPIDGAVAGEIARLLNRTGHFSGEADAYGESLRKALFAFVGTENLEERWSDEAKVEKKVLDYLREAAARSGPE